MAKAKKVAKLEKEPKQVGSKQDDDKLWGFLAVFLSIIGFIIVILLKKNSRYVTYYAKQSLVLFIAWVAACVVSLVPLLGLIISPILVLVVLVLWVIGWVNALSGKMKPIPVIGKYADQIKL